MSLLFLILNKSIKNSKNIESGEPTKETSPPILSYKEVVAKFVSLLKVKYFVLLNNDEKKSFIKSFECVYQNKAFSL